MAGFPMGGPSSLFYWNKPSTPTSPYSPHSIPLDTSDGDLVWPQRPIRIGPKANGSHDPLLVKSMSCAGNGTGTHAMHSTSPNEKHAMKRITHILLLIVATCAAAHAAEIGHFNGGLLNIRDYFVPEPGLYGGLYNYSPVVFCHCWRQRDTLRPYPILWVKGQTSHAASHCRPSSHRDRPCGDLSRSL
jgi:hypothetical protein